MNEFARSLQEAQEAIDKRRMQVKASNEYTDDALIAQIYQIVLGETEAAIAACLQWSGIYAGAPDTWVKSLEPRAKRSGGSRPTESSV